MAAGRKDANFSQGWGFATFVTLLAVGAFVLAGVIKQRTFVEPTDPLRPGSEREAAHAAPAGGEHGAAEH